MFFRKKKTSEKTDNSAEMASMVFNTIQEGVVVVSREGLIETMNPAAEVMLNMRGADAVGLVWDSVIRVESKEGRDFTDNDNPLEKAMNCEEGQKESMALVLNLEKIGKKLPVAITVLPVRGNGKILTMRNIEKELEEEGEQADFISTASHEMRTPVASIEGYLGLALNPQTATIDDRARKYLETAHKASVHLGELFKDLLDVTKLDDHKVQPRFQPVDLSETVKQMCDVYLERIAEAKLKFQFGAEEPKRSGGLMGFGQKKLSQVIYGYVDISFLREIIGNLIENAIKYTPEGGSIYVNVLGDGDRALINVTDTGIGIAADDLQHIFQKFYRADNSQTRTEGGTGLGLYLVKQRTEAMGGKVWAESAFGEGSTFYVSLPRITSEEYERRLTAMKNQQAVEAFNNLEVKQNVEQNAKLVEVMNQRIEQEVRPGVTQATGAPVATAVSNLAANSAVTTQNAVPGAGQVAATTVAPATSTPVTIPVTAPAATMNPPVVSRANVVQPAGPTETQNQQVINNIRQGGAND